MIEVCEEILVLPTFFRMLACSKRASSIATGLSAYAPSGGGVSAHKAAVAHIQDLLNVWKENRGRK